tara:strand:- start:47 stop:553 length:507 start_codon:yes stop_codon:yes gene_type:complete
MKQHGGSYRDIDYGLNHTLIEIARQFEKPPYFIYLSSMGVEWEKWSAYIKARADVERELKSSSLPYTVIRPGILSGESRDETRPLEALGAQLSFGISWIGHTLRWSSLSHKVRPLDAPEIASFIGHVLEAYFQNARADPTSYNSCYLVHHIHQTLMTHQLPPSAPHKD